MSDKSSIEWTEATWNPLRARFTDPITGAVRIGWHCEHVSSGCIHCYAEQINKGFFQLGTKQPYTRPSRDKVEIFLDEESLQQPLHWKKPRQIFVCSMTDLFCEWHTDEQIDQVFAVMALCPQHTFQVLTKRAERMHDYFDGARRRIAFRIVGFQPVRSQARTQSGLDDTAALPWPLPNVWLGVSVEDQKNANERIPWLLKTPAATRWVSYEPALGPVDFNCIEWLRDKGSDYFDALSRERHPQDDVGLNGAAVDWIVVGGESGPGSRPFDVQWARDTIAQFRAAGVPVFVKQLGGKPFERPSTLPHITLAFTEIKDKQGGNPDEWPADLRVREFPEVAK